MKLSVRHTLIVILSICGVLLPCVSSAQSVSASVPTFASASVSESGDTVATESYLLYYSHDDIDIDSTYLDNAQHIKRIKRIFERSPRIDSITIYAYASPEGSHSHNQWLSERRAEAARDLILSCRPNESVLSAENIYLRPMGENWEGLERELRDNYHLMNRDRVLKIMAANVPTETKKWRLKKLDNGYTYRMIVQHHMPRLRVATWICVFVSTPELEAPDTVIIPLPAPTPEVPEVPEAPEVPEVSVVPAAPVVPAVPDSLPADTLVVEPKKPAPAPAPELEEVVVENGLKTLFALKTNLLYDALSLVNYSVEVPITKHASVLAYHQFPWWRWGEAKNQYCIRFLSVGAEARWWFLPQPRPATEKRRERTCLMGHFLGVYGESGKWDFQWDRSICHQGEHWSAGLTYGYALPIGKHVNMEFSISAGYASIPYRKFTPSEDFQHLWADPEGRGRWHYFGPTKAQVSLVVPITMKTKRKGGAR